MRAPYTDAGLVALLLQSATPGLQCRDDAKQWCNIEVEAGELDYTSYGALLVPLRSSPA